MALDSNDRDERPHGQARMRLAEPVDVIDKYPRRTMVRDIPVSVIESARGDASRPPPSDRGGLRFVRP